jgi:hypothetical protein
VHAQESLTAFSVAVPLADYLSTILRWLPNSKSSLFSALATALLIASSSAGTHFVQPLRE